jgi:hypothetical protein
MSSTVTVPSALKPVPVIVIVSSTCAVEGSKVRTGCGMAKAVVLPVIVPTLTVTIVVPGDSDPPVEAAGISVSTLKAPVESVVNPPIGIPFALPKDMVEPVVFGGKATPLTVTIEPVDAAEGSTVTVPVGTFRLATALLLASAAVALTVGFKANALSVAVMVRVVAD